ncbi:MAG TPA: N-acetylglucosamine-6-phosphate deacetylase [Methylomirabilota bacterium]|nr:N-acetylglucosamine-6-phosphate deacetylase [Methylomirabilota bacterium]
MNGELHARYYATRQPIRISWDDGKIVSINHTTQQPQEDIWVAPPLFDLQINGYAGVDFQQDDVSAEDLLRAVRALRRDGCAYFFLTLITDEWPRLLTRLKRFRELRETSAELREAIRGWHIEGPFLSARPGFHGAHHPQHMRDPRPEDIRELRSATGIDPVLLTIAPERSGAMEAIELAISAGIRVSLGHTNASAEILRAAVSAGATGFTHLANGCPRELDRHDNILIRVCDTERLTVSLIPDSIHVPAPAFRVLHRAVSGPIYYTTDAMAAAGAGPGRYRIGAVEVEVGADQIVRQPGSTNFAGSALRPIDGVFRAAKMLNGPWQECWRRFSEAPAKFIGCQNELRVGSPATFCAIQFTNEQPSVRMLWDGS